MNITTWAKGPPKALGSLLHYVMLSFSSQERLHSPAGPPTVAYTRWWPADPPFGIFSQLHYGREGSDWESCRIPITSFYTVQIGLDVQNVTSGHCKYTRPKQHIKIKFSDQYSPTTMMSKYILKWESVDLHEKTIVLEEILNTEYTNNSKLHNLIDLKLSMKSLWNVKST